jgi:2'-5' RNA ligase
MMRLFIGIALPLVVGEALANAARKLLPAGSAVGARLRWTRPENMHVTLSFLGEVAPSRLTLIQQRLEEVHAVRFNLMLSGIGTFPRAGILHASLMPSAELYTLAEQISFAMGACGFFRKQHTHTPHVTLARYKGGAFSPPRGKDDPAFTQAFEAREFRLYQSITRPEGSHYEALAVYPLA